MASHIDSPGERSPETGERPPETADEGSVSTTEQRPPSDSEPGRHGPRPRRSVTRRALTQHLPRVAILATLGAATVGAPLFGGSLVTGGASDAVAAPVQAIAAVSDSVPAPESDAAATGPGATKTQAFRVVSADGSVGGLLRLADGGGATAAPSPDQLTASRTEAERASRDLVRSVLPGCDGVVGAAPVQNGRLPAEDLCALWEPGDSLRADAAVALANLNVAYQQHFGTPLVITDSYRSYEQQVSVKARKPGLAAVPGTSEHGWGLAVDLGGGVEGAGEPYQWLRQNAPAFGWDNPDWARSGGSGAYEPWHWEYVAGQPPAPQG